MTKDERFLVEFYRIVGESDTPISLSTISEKVSFSPKQIKNIVRGLAQANFIKKHDDEFALTDLGRNLAKSLTQ